MSSEERIMTAYFWRSLRTQKFGMQSGYDRNLNHSNDRLMEQQNGIMLVTYYELEKACREVNNAMLEAMVDGTFNRGIIPEEAYPERLYSKDYEPSSRRIPKGPESSRTAGSAQQLNTATFNPMNKNSTVFSINSLNMAAAASISKSTKGNTDEESLSFSPNLTTYIDTAGDTTGAQNNDQSLESHVNEAVDVSGNRLRKRNSLVIRTKERIDTDAENNDE
jgi:hypothetical protein